jgi:hypothetical protein
MFLFPERTMWRFGSSHDVLVEGFRSIENQKNSYGCEQESQDLI